MKTRHTKLKIKLAKQQENNAPNKTKKFKTWPCRKCGKTFPTQSLLREHRKPIDLENRRNCNGLEEEEEDRHTYKFDPVQDLYICNTCSAEYQEKEEISKHLETHDESFECDMCEEKFKKAYFFAIHKSKHSKDDAFNCPQCRFSTTDRRRLHKHIQSIHMQKFYFSCSMCGKGFNDTLSFKEHENGHSGIRPFVCVVCNKNFIYSRYLYNHQVRLHKVLIEGQWLPNQCKICNAIFSKPASLERHLETHVNVTPREKKILCDICGKGFSTNTILNRHYRMHTGYKPFKCRFCEKTFSEKGHLAAHERVHTGEKPYHCEYCGRGFVQSTGLKIHVRSHTGERPFVCQRCNAGFTSKNALKFHCKTCVY